MPDKHCTATIHGTIHAYRHHNCRCHAVVNRMRALWRRHNKPYQRTGRRHGWSNRTDVDPVAVTLVANDGHRLELTNGERRAVVAELVQRGWKTHRIADRLGVTTRTVQRLKPAA